MIPAEIELALRDCGIHPVRIECHNGRYKAHLSNYSQLTRSASKRYDYIATLLQLNGLRLIKYDYNWITFEPMDRVEEVA